MAETIKRVIEISVDASKAVAGQKAATSAAKELEQSLKGVSTQLTATQSGLNITGTFNAQFSQNLDSAVSGVDGMVYSLGAVAAQAKATTPALTAAGAAAGSLARRHNEGVIAAEAQASGLQRLGAAATSLKGIFAAAGAAFVGSQVVRELIAVEDGLVALRNSTNLTDEGIREVADSMTFLSTRIALPKKQLEELAITAARLGAQTPQDISKFVQTFAQSQSTTGIGSSQDALNISKLLRARGEDPLKGVQVYVATLNTLADTLAVSEREIDGTAQSIASLTSDLKLSIPQLLALAGALTAMGSEGGSAGLALNRLFSVLKTGGREGKDAIDVLSKLTGLASGDFKKAIEQDATGALITVLRSLQNLQKSGGDVRVVLDQLGLADARVARSILPLINNVQLLEKALNQAGDSVASIEELQTESSRVADTLGNQLSAFGNAVSGVVKKAADATGPLAFVVKTLKETLQELTGTADKTGDATARSGGAAKFLASSIQFATISATAFVALNLVSKMGGVTNAFFLAAGAVRSFTIALARTPFGLAALAIGAVSLALIDLNENLSDSGEGFDEAAAKQAEWAAATKNSADVATRLALAIRDNDVRGQARAIQDRIDLLKKERVELEATAERVKNRNSQGVSVGLPSSLTGEAAKRLRELPEEIKAAEEQLAQLGPKLAQAFQPGEITKFDTEFKKILEDLKFETSLIGLSADAREKAILLRKIETQATEAQVTSTEKYTKQITEALAEKVKLAKEASLVKSFTETAAALKSEIDLLKIDSESREDIAASTKNFNEALKTGNPVLVSYSVYLAALMKMRQELKANTELSKTFKEESAEIEFQTSLIGKSNEEREKETRIRAFVKKAVESQATGIDLYVKKLRELLDVNIRAAAAEEQRAAATKSSNQILNSVRALDAEIRLIKQYGSDTEKLTEARERAAQIVDIQRQAEEAFGGQTLLSIAAVSSYVAKLTELQDAQRRAAGSQGIRESNEALEDQFRIIGASSVVQENSAAILKRMSDAQKLYGRNTREASDDVKAFVGRLEEMEELKKLETIAKDTGQAVGNAFERFFFETQNLRDLTIGLLKDISAAVLRELATKQLVGAVTGLVGSAFGLPGAGGGLFGGGGSGGASSMGNLFRSGSVVAFANGGYITNGPEYFPMSGGRTGLRGEAGDELVAPIKRTRDGKPGLTIEGLGGRSTVINMTVNARDAGSFNESKTQIVRRLRKAMQE